jgi:hypothetical protein
MCLLGAVHSTGATGRERTAAEHEGLLASAGFRLDAIRTTPTPISILEATRT